MELKSNDDTPNLLFQLKINTEVIIRYVTIPKY